MKLIQFKNFSHGNLKDINLEIGSGEIILLSGANLCGKSILLSSMKKSLLKNHGGEVDFFIDDEQIAYVSQNLDSQLILSTVLSELVFTMENLRFDSFTMNKRLAECVNFFGIADLLDKNISELSGGQKQLILLCSAIITRPKIILIDDIFSQLDAILQNSIFNLIKLMHEEFDITFVIVSSNLDNVIKICQRVIFISDGQILIDGPVQNSLRKLFSSPFKLFLPPVSKLSIEKNLDRVCLTRQEFKKLCPNAKVNAQNKIRPISKNNSPICLKNISYKYDSNPKFVINNLSWRIEHKINCIIGANGSGKSTLLKLIAKIFKPYCGSVMGLPTNVKYLPQNALNVFALPTFIEQIDSCKDKNFALELAKLFNVSFAMDANIYDLPPSCQQILAFIYLAADRPDVLILDEPTKFLDKTNVKIMREVLQKLDTTVIIASHNIDFVYQLADNCIMLFNGNIAYEQSPFDFFSHNSFYTLNCFA